MSSRARTKERVVNVVLMIINILIFPVILLGTYMERRENERDDLKRRIRLGQLSRDLEAINREQAP